MWGSTSWWLDISCVFSLALPTKRSDLEVLMCGIYTKNSNVSGRHVSLAEKFVINFNKDLQWHLLTGTISGVVLVFCCDLKGSITCGAGKCDVTQPCIVFKQAFSWCQKVPNHGALWVRLQGKADVLNPGVESWQANSKYFRLHGKYYASPPHDGTWGGGVTDV